MLQTCLLCGKSAINYLASSKCIKYVGIGMALLSANYNLLSSKKKRIVNGIAGSSIRFARSLKIGVTISLDYWIAPLVGHTYTKIHQRSVNRILQGCLKNSGIYVKVGQGLAAANNILPEEYIETLSTLQDKCLTRGKDEIEEIFLQDFGKKPEEILCAIESEPVAAASLAQVYKGITLDGNDVAIKVQYIDLQDRFISDMKALVFLFKAASVVHPKFDLYWVVDEVLGALAKELDFENEGKNGEQCAEDLKRFEYAYVPKVYWDLTSQRVLTTEWIDGVKVTDVEGIRALGLDLADVDHKLIVLMAEQIFHTGFVHGDPHPGNVLIRKGRDNNAQVVLLDHGLYEHLSDKTRRALCNFWEAIVLKNDYSLKTHASDLNVKDYVLLAEMLTQAPYSISFASCLDNVTMDEYMQRQAQKQFDKITSALKSMPNSMILVIRNLNTIRAIIKDHGDVVNRYRIMARIATRGKYHVAKQSFYKNIASICSTVKFEFRLWLHDLVQWLLNVYLNLLRLVGYDVTKMLQML